MYRDSSYACFIGYYIKEKIRLLSGLESFISSHFSAFLSLDKSSEWQHFRQQFIKNLPLLKCGYTEKDIATASPDDMDFYYSKEKQEKYGVVGIEVEVLGWYLY